MYTHKYVLWVSFYIQIAGIGFCLPTGRSVGSILCIFELLISYEQ